MYLTAISYEQSLQATLYSEPGHELREVEKVVERFAACCRLRGGTAGKRGGGEARSSAPPAPRALPSA